MKRSNPGRERGAALLALLAAIMLGASWFFLSKLNAETGAVSAVNRARNAAVLYRAKLALIGYVAQKTAVAGENNPGRLPCPETTVNIGTAASEGYEGPWPSPPSATTTACTSIGRLPWRTLGLEKLLDSANEPLWYVVGPAWRLTADTTTLLINSNTAGDSTLDGQQVVALIIAPGQRMNVQSATGCTARNQNRGTPSPAINAADYIECFNSGTLQFISTASSTSYNDQVVSITAAEIMQAVEPVIANRIEREILPALRAVYTPALWGFTGTNPVLPYPATFSNPGSGTGTSNYRGASGTYAGLLPFNQSQNCTEAASNPRCTTATSGGTALMIFSKSGNDTKTGAGSIQTQSTCAWSSTEYVCTGEYLQPTISLTFRLNVTNVAMGLRTFDVSKVYVEGLNDTTGGWGTTAVSFTATPVLNANGSVTMTIVSSAFPDIVTAGWGTYANYRVRIDRAAFGDHALLSTTNTTTGWFARNEWYRLVYYAVAASNTAQRLPLERACATAGDCLSLTTGTTSATKSALLVLAGLSVNGRARPSSTLTDYFEFGNAKGSYENQTVVPSAVGRLYADTGSANAYAAAATSLSTGATLQFRAANANTGSSTLTTTATGTKPLLNQDGTALATSAIQANSAVQVVWDGSVFRLSKRPFNDRVVSVASN